MGSEIETLQERLKSFLDQLQAECGIFERMVYKNKNQHRRSSYFQYLLKVRRDLRLLQSSKLGEILGSCFHVITGKKPKQKVHFLESLKWRKRDCGKPNFMEQLLGAARLLSQMVEPMLMAAIQVSTLLARSFFMGFSLTILALLARLRVLVQQILLDVVSVFNMVTSVSQKKQSVKITQEGIEVFREYFPTNKEFVTLECLWETDKFTLLERTHKSEAKGQEVGLGDASSGASAVRYSVEAFLGDDDSDFEKADENFFAKAGSTSIKEDNKNLHSGLSIKSERGKQVQGGVKLGDNPIDAGSPDKEPSIEDVLVPTSSSSPDQKSLTPKSSARPVAFVSVKRPAPSTTEFIPVKRPATSTANVMDPNLKEAEKDSNAEDSFFNLLTGGNLKDSLF